MSAPCGALVYATINPVKEPSYLYTGFGCLDEMDGAQQALPQPTALNDIPGMCCGFQPGGLKSPPPPPAQYPPGTAALEVFVQTDLPCDNATRALREVRRRHSLCCAGKKSRLCDGTGRIGAAPAFAGDC